MTYDDLLTGLERALRPPGGAAVAARLHRRYPVVLVDEFQDTDPIQWEILQRAFGNGTLVLIGDPKQAIYAFRGADVYAYLDAARAAVAHATLEVNWRSDQGLIDAYDALFDGAQLGHEGIVYRQVRAAEANRTPRLTGARGAAARPRRAPRRARAGAYGARVGEERLRARVHRPRPRRRRRRGCSRPARRSSAAPTTARCWAGRRSRPATSRCSCARTASPPRSATRSTPPASRRSSTARAACSGPSRPATGCGCWRRSSGPRPARAPAPSRSRRSSAGPRSASRCAEEAEWEDVHRRLHAWARVLRQRGVAALAETVSLAQGLPARVLARPDGERELTDLRHVAQLLHAAATTEQLGTTALAAWLRRRIAEAADDTADEERSRRLESDADAVQVLTVHRSKGLEFPIVYFPDLWEPGFIPKAAPVVFHDPAAGDRRTIDVGLEGAAYLRHKQLALVEQRGEDLRLAYVALTRARHQAVVWWAGSWDSRDSALGRLLFARGEGGAIAASGSSTPTDSKVVERFEALAAAAPGRIAVERALVGLPVSWAGLPRDPGELTASRFDRELDRRWRRTSYSDITAAAHEARVASEPEEGVTDDEPEPATPPPAVPGGDPALEEVPSRLAEMPAGVDIGTFVHRVLEATDFAAPDLTAELTARVAETRARRQLEIGDPATAVAGLRAALETPLGPLAGGRRLCDIARADRLDELTFELPLAGGDRPSGSVTLAAIAAALDAHLPPGDPLAGYAARLRDPALRRTVRGYLTGSIDLVVRLGDGYAIADYKTNWLAAPGEELSMWQHRPAALAAEMERAHYGLQALLYTVALHRYLRWRLRGYDPGRHLAGVLYLFLRGMRGADTPVVGDMPCGVFAWKPPAALVVALSDALGRRPVIAADALRRPPGPCGARPPARVQRRGRARAGRRPRGATAGRRRPTRRWRWRSRSRSARRGSATSTSTSRPCARPRPSSPRSRSTSPRCRGRTPRAGRPPWPPPRSSRRARTGRRTARCGCSARGSTSTATGARSAGSPPTCARWRRTPPGGVDAALLADGHRGALFAAAGPTAARRAPPPRRCGERFAVVAGGPGTGKTTTVARIVALLAEQAPRPVRRAPLVALAAPTGKAAARLEEAVHDEARELDVGAGRPRPAARARAPRRCTGCSAGGRTATAASATTAATASRTTS